MTEPGTEWHTPLQRLVQESAALLDTLAQHDTRRINGDLQALLRTSWEVENALSQSHATRRDFNDPVNRIRSHCHLLLNQTDLQPWLRNALLAQIAACDQFARSSSTAHSIGALPSVAAPGRVLIIAEKLQAALLVKLVSNMGHQAEAVEALGSAVLGRFQPELLLWDLGEQPEGIVTQMQRTEREIPSLLVADPEAIRLVVDCLEAGADDFLFKPISPVLLRVRLNAGLERYRARQREASYRRELERNQRFIRSTFGRYLSESMLERLLERPEVLEPGGKLCTVTVLTIDIHNFAPLCEQLPAGKVVSMLNHFLGIMTDVALAHDSTINAVPGDAILAVFGAPLADSTDVDRAIHCALAMRAAMADVNRWNRERGLPSLQIGIALHTGKVIAGNIGAEKRSRYGVVGPAVTTVARLQRHAPANGILISAASVEASKNLLCLGASQTLPGSGERPAVALYTLLGQAPA
ncbi:MAG TPA: adenylate/guanylate cyclase domain-containing protein [Spongiibacteraceae bacterium]|jgi:class 3 adenylate cyclase|nr:adenylate/guanylate cyclase domain-containing protein [Spongiibacteraceae bacterium]HUH39202.1 adenylate/guanylate cyclase domain-containing protein [Spongiibacteraceae bacterium]